jgi:hypothetical protein
MAAAHTAEDELASLPPLNRERRTAGEDAVDELARLEAVASGLKRQREATEDSLGYARMSRERAVRDVVAGADGAAFERLQAEHAKAVDELESRWRSAISRLAEDCDVPLSG